MDVFTYLLLATVTAFLWLLLKKKNEEGNEKRNGKSMPPGPKGLPLIGNLLSLRSNAYLAYRRYMKYGDVCTVKVGMTRMIVLNSYRAMQEALVNQGDVFTGRPKSEHMDAITRCSGIAFIDGPVWKEHRRFTLRLMRNFGFGKPLAQEIVRDECHQLGEWLGRHLERGVNTKAIFEPVVTNIISRLLFSERLTTEDPNFKEFQVALDVIANSPPITFLPTFSWMLKLPLPKFLISSTIRFCEAFDVLHCFIQKKIKQRSSELKNLASPLGDLTDANDVCEAFLIEMDKQEKSNPGKHTFTDWQVMRNLLELLGAGIDTSATTLTWTTLLLAVHPNVQRRIQSEIEEKIGRDRLPIMTDRTKLPFACAVMDEVLRYTSVVPTGLPLRTLEDTELLGFFIPANTIVHTNTYGIQHDPGLWERPDEFYPQHFLSGSGEYQPSKYLNPFSIGKRACLGESLARMQIFLVLVFIMQRFHVRLADPAADVDAILEGTLGLARHPLSHKIVFSAIAQQDSV